MDLTSLFTPSGLTYSRTSRSHFSEIFPSLEGCIDLLSYSDGYVCLYIPSSFRSYHNSPGYLWSRHSCGYNVFNWVSVSCISIGQGQCIFAMCVKCISISREYDGNNTTIWGIDNYFCFNFWVILVLILCSVDFFNSWEAS